MNRHFAPVFRQHRKSLLLATLLAFVFLCGALLLLEAQAKPLRRWIDTTIYDNQAHYLPCSALPALAEVEATVAAHQDVITQIRQVNPGLVGVDIDSTQCPGKADLVIWYGSHQNRLTIEEILDADTFFGVPYRLNNR
ncbi:MAG: hypothetical protein WAZ19_01980 [Anaerolineae bacterium]